MSNAIHAAELPKNFCPLNTAKVRPEDCGSLSTCLARPDAPESAPKDVGAIVNYGGDFEGVGIFDALTPANTTFRLSSYEVTIKDARPIRDELKLQDVNFEFVRHECPEARDERLLEENLQYRLDAPTGVTKKYLASVAERLKQLTGARQMIPQVPGTVARTAPRSRTQTWAGPATFAHADWTEKSARDFLDWSCKTQNIEIEPHSHWVVLQTWRPLTPPPQDYPLAVCDGREIPTDKIRVIAAQVRPEDAPCPEGLKRFENMTSHYHEDLDWHYLSGMDVSDLLVFVGFDIRDPLTIQALHSSFENPYADENSVPRRSIEARFYAFFD